MKNPFDFSHIQTVMGVAIYAFEAVGILMTVKASMKKQEKFKRLIQMVTLTTVLINIVFSVVSSLGFGAKIN